MERFKKFRKQNLPIMNGTFRSYQEFLTLEESQWASRIKVCTNKEALMNIYNNFNNIKAKELIKIRLRELKIKVGDDVKKSDFKPQINILKSKFVR